MFRCCIWCEQEKEELLALKKRLEDQLNETNRKLKESEQTQRDK